MDLRDIQTRLKQRSKELEITEISIKQKGNSLVERIIGQYQKDRKILLFGIFSILSVVVLYAIFSYRSIARGGDISELYFYGLASAGFLSLLPWLIYQYRGLGRQDYSEATIKFLETAEKRFRFLCKGMFFFIPFLILLDAAFCSFVIYRMDFWGLSTLMRILTVQVGFLLYLSLPIGLGYIYWKNKRSPILQEIREVRLQFEEGPMDEFGKS